MAKEEGAPKKKKVATPKKRLIQSEKRRCQNKAARSCIKTRIRAFKTSIEQADAEKGGELLKEVHSLLDKASKKGLFKQNKSARLKSKLSSQLHSIAS